MLAKLEQITEKGELIQLNVEDSTSKGELLLSKRKTNHAYSRNLTILKEKTPYFRIQKIECFK